MSYLWISKDGGAWSEIPLDSPCGERLEPAPGSDWKPRLQQSGNDWVMLFAPDTPAAANGLPCTLRILSDRDEIVCWPPGERPSHVRLAYSAERQAVVRPFHRAAGAGEVFCGRCRTPVADGEPAVVCPKCGVPHHGTDDSPCWTAGPRCSCCDQNTNPGTELEWTPCDI